MQVLIWDEDVFFLGTEMETVSHIGRWGLGVSLSKDTTGAMAVWEHNGCRIL